jgi:ABC-type oligopeptide transport system substrate-binding subunit
MEETRMSFKSRFKLLQLLVAGLLLATLLGACGATATPTTAPTTAAPTRAATTAAAPAATTAAPVATTAAAPAATTAAPVATTAAATTGGVFRHRMVTQPKTLDPGFMTDAESIEVGQNIYQGLYEFNAKNEIIPGAAEAAPTVSADGKTYTIKLRSGLKWNNGDALTAQDFIYAWNRVAQLGAKAEYGEAAFGLVDGYAAVAEEKDDAKRQAGTISGIKAVDANTLEIKLRQAGSYFSSALTLWTFWPVQQKTVEGKGNKWDEKNTWSSEAGIVTNGAFTVKEWKKDVSMRFEPNPNFVGTKPSVQAVTLDFIKEDATAFLKYVNNELDDVIVPATDILKIKRDAKYKDAYKEVPAARVTWLAFNMNPDTPNAFNKNLKLRQAFWYAMDRQLLTEGAMQGAGVPATILVPPGFLSFKEQNAYPFSVDKAKQMLKDAGYDTADKLKALQDEINNHGGGKYGGIAYNESSINKAVWENVQQQVKTNLGLELKMNPVAAFAEFLKLRDEDKVYVMYRGSWGADYLDPQNFYEPLFGSKAGTNQSNYKNPKYDELVGKGNVATSPAARAEAYQAAEKLLQDDAAYVPLFYGVITRVIRPTIQNYEYTPKQPTQWKYMTIRK